MRWKLFYEESPWVGGGGAFKALRIRTKLWLTLVPTVVTILVIMGYVSHWFSSRFLQEAVSRTVLIQTLGVAHEFETVMDRCREDLLWAARGALTEERLRQVWAGFKAARGWGYAEIGFVEKTGGSGFVLAMSGEDVEPVVMEPGTSLWDGLDTLYGWSQGPPESDPGPWIGPVVHVGYRSRDGTAFYGKATHVVRFIARAGSQEGGRPRGSLFFPWMPAGGEIFSLCTIHRDLPSWVSCEARNCAISTSSTPRAGLSFNRKTEWIREKP